VSFIDTDETASYRLVERPSENGNNAPPCGSLE